MGIFRATQEWGWWGVNRPPSVKSVTHILQLDTVISYLKKIQKKYESCDTTIEFCLHQRFFIGNQQILLYQKIQI